MLALTGYQPNFSFLENRAILLSKDDKKIPVYNPQTMETNNNGIYLAVVICGGMETHKWFIENSIVHTKIMLNSIIEK